MQKEAKKGEKCAIMGFEPMTPHFLAACATTELGCRLYDVVEVHDVKCQYDTSYYVVRRAVRQLSLISESLEWHCEGQLGLRSDGGALGGLWPTS